MGVSVVVGRMVVIPEAGQGAGVGAACVGGTASGRLEGDGDPAWGSVWGPERGLCPAVMMVAHRALG